MIRRLFFGSDPGAHLAVADSRNRHLALSHNLYWGDRALVVITAVWLVTRLFAYYELAQRPPELFAPEHWFGRLFMPSLPGMALWHLVWGAAVLLTLAVWLHPAAWYYRLGLVLLLAWVNIAQWSYGFNSHVCYLFLLAHLFSTFIPFARPGRNPMPHAPQFAALLYGGVLLSYTGSGFWKVVGLVYKFTRPEPAVTWIDPEAALYNAVVSFRNYDQGYERFDWSMGWPLFWQISFWLVMFMQLGSVLFAGRFRALPWMMVMQMGFHVVNIVFFSTIFWLAQFVLLGLFFPYHLVLRGWQSHATSLKSQAYDAATRTLRLTYADGSETVYTGFGALRERLYCRWPILAGLLYFPGVATVGRLLWRG